MNDDNIVNKGQSSHTAYTVEYKNEDGIWKTMNWKKSTDGIPGPICHSGFNSDHDLLGFEQAMALAWIMKAKASHRPFNEIYIYGIRIMPHLALCTYSIEKKEEEAEELEHSFGGTRPWKKNITPVADWKSETND